MAISSKCCQIYLSSKCYVAGIQKPFNRKIQELCKESHVEWNFWEESFENWGMPHEVVVVVVVFFNCGKTENSVPYTTKNIGKYSWIFCQMESAWNNQSMQFSYLLITVFLG